MIVRGLMLIKDSDWSKFTARTELNSTLDEGLYFFNIELASKLFEGWFIYTEAKTNLVDNIQHKLRMLTYFNCLLQIFFQKEFLSTKR